MSIEGLLVDPKLNSQSNNIRIVCEIERKITNEIFRVKRSKNDTIRRAT